jgi:hypothetical protein
MRPVVGALPIAGSSMVRISHTTLVLRISLSGSSIKGEKPVRELVGDVRSRDVGDVLESPLLEPQPEPGGPAPVPTGMPPKTHAR